MPPPESRSPRPPTAAAGRGDVLSDWHRLDAGDDNPNVAEGQPEHISRPVGRVLAQIHRQHLAEWIHRLAPRTMQELLLEVVTGADLDERRTRYAETDLAIIRALGADGVPPSPNHRVR